MACRVRSGDHLLGISLVEVIIVLGIFSILLATSHSLYLMASDGQNLEIATVSIVETLRSAKVRATQGDGDARWGVHIGSPDLTVFRGSSYASRDVSSDQKLTLPRGVTVSGVSEIVFSKITGSTTPGSITLTNGAGSKTIQINAYGTIDY